MRIPFYFCDIANFGDALNKPLFKQLVNAHIKPEESDRAKVIGIGSLLDMLLVDLTHSKKDMSKEELFVFSTGFGFEEGGFFHNQDIVFPEKLKRSVKCYALRGKKTKERMERILGESLDSVTLGDGGLLSNLLIDTGSVKKKYKLGIVPHFADKKHPIFSKINHDIKHSVILDVRSEPLEFLHKLAECESVISTAMHPLIACDSLRIPNRWVRIFEHTTSRYKFDDYYSVFDTQKTPLNLLDTSFRTDSLKKIVHAYDITDSSVKRVQSELMSALNKMENDLVRQDFPENILLPLTNFMRVVRAKA